MREEEKKNRKRKRKGEGNRKESNLWELPMLNCSLWPTILTRMLTEHKSI
jgi:hypothetical protein